MADNKDYISRSEDKGSINISEDVVAMIAASAAKETEGVDSLAGSLTEDWSRLLGKKNMPKGIKLVFSENEIALDIYIIVKLDYQLDDVALKVQEAVATAIESTVGFAVTSVNVHVSGIAVK